MSTAVSITSLSTSGGAAITFDQTGSGGIGLDGNVTSASGTVTLTSQQGISRNSGTIAASALSATAVTGLALTTAVTTFNQIASTSGAISISQTGSIALPSITAASTLSITATGAITQQTSSALTVNSGSATFSTSNADINLDKDNNSFGGTINITKTGTGNVTVKDTHASALSLSSITLTTGNLTLIDTSDIALSNPITLNNGSLVLEAGGSIYQNGSSSTDSLTVSGSTSATATTGYISLLKDNDFVGPITVSAISGVDGVVSITSTNANGIAIDSLTAGSELSIFSTGAITSSGPISVGGRTSINLAGDITWNNADNSLTGSIYIYNASSFSLTNSRAVTLDTRDNFGSTITGNLSITANGSISQSTPSGATNALRVNGTTTLSAGWSNDITLYNAANNFGGAFSVTSGKDISVRDSGSLVLGSITANGSLNIAATNNVTLAGNLTTNRGAINIDNGSAGNTAVLLGTGAVLDTTNSSSTPASDPGAAVTLRGSIAGIPSSSYGLTIKGGNTGDVLITGTVGAVGTGNTAPSALVIGGNDISVASLDGVGAISIAAADGTGADTGSITLTSTTYRALTSLEIASGARIGNSPLINSILLNGGGATTLSTRGGANLEISGTINLNGLALTLDSTADGAVAAGGTIYVNDAIEGPGSLSINAGTTGVASINHLSGAIGATTPLTGVTLTNADVAGFSRNISAGTLTLNATNTITLQGQLTLTGGLITTANPYALSFLSGNNTHSTVAGTTTFLNTGALELGDAGGDAFTFAGGVVGTAPASIRLVGTIGSTSGAITLGDANTTVNVIAATIGGSSTGAISLGPITLAEGGGLTVGTGIANTVQMSSVSGSTSNTYPETLTINTSSAATIDGAISNLGTLTITKAAGTTFNGAITATTIDIGTIPVGGGSTPNTVRFAGNLNVGTLNTSSGNYGIEIVGSSNIVNTTTFNNTYYVAIGDSTADTSLFSNGLVIPSTVTTGAYLIGTIRSSGAAINLSRSYFTGNTIFDSTNNGASMPALVTLINTNAAGHNLTITGNASLSGTLTNVDNFSVSGTTDPDLPTSAIATSGAQAYGGGIILQGNTTLTGSNITLGGTVNGAGYSLNLNGNAIFNGTTSNLSSLTVGGTSTARTGSITTSGSQFYTGLFTLDAPNVSLSGSSSTFSAGISGTGNSLSLNFSGNTALDGASMTGIANLSTGSIGTTAITGSFQTTGIQSYGNPVNVAPDTTLSAIGMISFASTLNSDGNLVLNTHGGNLSLGTANIISGSFTAVTNNGTISQLGPLTVEGSTTLSTGNGNITLMNSNNTFAEVPLTISSSGVIQIFPCSAANNCTNPASIPTWSEITPNRQDILQTDAGLTQNNQLASNNNNHNISKPLTSKNSSPETTNFAVQNQRNQRYSFGQSSFEIKPSEEVCLSPNGCSHQTLIQPGKPAIPTHKTEDGGLKIRGIDKRTVLPNVDRVLKTVNNLGKAFQITQSHLQNLTRWLQSQR